MHQAPWLQATAAAWAMIIIILQPKPDLIPAGLSRKHTLAMMCAEGNPFRCHRSLIADALTRQCSSGDMMKKTKYHARALGIVIAIPIIALMLYGAISVNIHCRICYYA